MLGIDLPKDQQSSDWSGSLTSEQLAYAAHDAAVLLPLVERLKGQALDMQLARVVRLESELMPVVIDMMLAGVGVDGDALDRVVAAKRARAESLAHELKARLGVTNPRSQPQILRALLAIGIRTKKTSAEALAKYAAHHEVVRQLFEFRSADSFVRGLGQHLIDGALRYPDGRLHARLRPLAAPTGRFGASDPNLLAVPKDPDMRRCVVAPLGFKLVSGDYAAIELRVLAEVTRDAKLLETFNSGRCPHRTTASLILGKSYDDITKGEKNSSKPINFGFSFGQGPESFVPYAMKNFNVAFELNEARKFRAAFLSQYRGVDAWQHRTKRQVSRDVRTASGRLRRFADARTSYTKRLNTPIQGTAADGIKRAMVLLHQRLPTFGARLILCVHDELVVEAPDASVAEVERVVRETMIEAMSEFVKNVPIVVETHVGQTWADDEGVENVTADASTAGSARAGSAACKPPGPGLNG